MTIFIVLAIARVHSVHIMNAD